MFYMNTEILLLPIMVYTVVILLSGKGNGITSLSSVSYVSLLPPRLLFMITQRNFILRISPFVSSFFVCRWFRHLTEGNSVITQLCPTPDLMLSDSHLSPWLVIMHLNILYINGLLGSYYLFPTLFMDFHAFF